MTLSRVGGRSEKWDRDRNKHQQPKNGTPSCIPMSRFSRLERGFGQKGVRGWDLAREAVFLEATQLEAIRTGLPVTKTYLQTKSMHSTRHSLFTEVRLALSTNVFISSSSSSNSVRPLLCSTQVHASKQLWSYFGPF